MSGCCRVKGGETAVKKGAARSREGGSCDDALPCAEASDWTSSRTHAARRISSPLSLLLFSLHQRQVERGSVHDTDARTLFLLSDDAFHHGLVQLARRLEQLQLSQLIQQQQQQQQQPRAHASSRLAQQELGRTSGKSTRRHGEGQQHAQLASLGRPQRLIVIVQAPAATAETLDDASQHSWAVSRRATLSPRRPPPQPRRRRRRRARRGRARPARDDGVAVCARARAAHARAPARARRLSLAPWRRRLGRPRRGGALWLCARRGRPASFVRFLPSCHGSTRSC